MPSKRRIWQTALLLGILLPGAGSQATTILRQSLGQLVDEAPLIFVGSAIDQQVALPAGASSPVTLVTFDVEEVLKGATADPKLTLAFEGGEWEGEVFEVIGMPTFDTGSRYLLILRSNGADGGCPTAGWWQGKLTFTRHPLAGTEILVDHRGAPVLGLDGEEWLKGPVTLDDRGLLRAKADPGIEVEREEGVTISGLADPELTAQDALAAVPEARQLLSSLRRLVQRRQGLGSFREGETLRSAGLGDLALRAPSTPQPILPADRGGEAEEVRR